MTRASYWFPKFATPPWTVALRTALTRGSRGPRRPRGGGLSSRRRSRPWPSVPCGPVRSLPRPAAPAHTPSLCRIRHPSRSPTASPTGSAVSAESGAGRTREGCGTTQGGGAREEELEAGPRPRYSAYMTIVLDSLRVVSAGHVLVDDVNLIVEPASRTVLVGASGAGKSLTCKASDLQGPGRHPAARPERDREPDRLQRAGTRSSAPARPPASR